VAVNRRNGATKGPATEEKASLKKRGGKKRIPKGKKEKVYAQRLGIEPYLEDFGKKRSGRRGKSTVFKFPN